MVQFGVSNWSAEDGTAWHDDARRFEQLGFDTLWVADHIGMFDPFTALVAAAGATERLRALVGGNGDRVLRLAGEQADVRAAAGDRWSAGRDGRFCLC